MRDDKKTKRQLIKELNQLRKQAGQTEKPSDKPDKRSPVTPKETFFMMDLLNIADVILLVIDARQKVLYVNRKGCDVLQYNREEIIGKNWFDSFIPGNIRDGVKAVFERLMKGDEEPVEFFENPVQRKNGDEKLIAWRNMVLRDKTGKIIGSVSSGQDITEFKRIGEDLLTAQKSKSIGILAAGIAHDLNNILTAILGNLTLAKMSSTLDSDTIMRLNEAEKASENAKTLISQLLSFAEGVEYITRTPFVAELLKSAVKFTLRGSNIKCKFEFPASLWPIKFPTNQFIQVMSTLTIVIRKGMPEGGQLRVSAENIRSEDIEDIPLLGDKYVKITLCLKGLDLPDNYFEQLLIPGQSSGYARSSSEITATYSVIKSHGGFIHVKSIKSEGTVVSFYIPASEEAIQVMEKEKGSVRTGKGKILLMDDDEMVLNTTGVLMEHLGYKVEFAREGEEAVRLYRKSIEADERFDAVILDLTVPGGMGAKLTLEKLQQLDPDIVALLSSGYTTDQTMVNFKKYGFRATVKKPYNLEELSAALHSILGKNKSA